MHGDDNGNYALSSLYYDTADYRFYWEKKDGIKFRRKLRIRYYESREVLKSDSEVFLEIKQRLDRVIQKRRAILPYKDALDLCNNRTIPEHGSRAAGVVEEAYCLIQQYDLRPMCITSYLRQAFVGSEYDAGLRITFDTDIRYKTEDLCLHSPKAGAFMISPELSIMEIKVNESIPYWLTELVANFNFSLIPK